MQNDQRMIERLRKRWFLLLKNLGGKSSSAEDWWRKINKSYSESHRVYHTFHHIDHCLKELDTAKLNDKNIRNLIIIELAIWFHDLVYITQNSSNVPVLPGLNEKESAHLVLKFLGANSFPEKYRDEIEVACLILSTIKHEPIVNTSYGQLFLDIDLSILGQSPEVFDEYEKGIRKEYEHVPEETFRKKRAEILKSFLGRKNIYFTGYFQDKYETQARENLKRSVAKLESENQDDNAGIKPWSQTD